jgi:hypothetical protein
VLSVLTRTSPRPEARKPTWHRRLVTRAAKPHESTGLAGSGGGDHRENQSVDVDHVFSNWTVGLVIAVARV